MTSRWARVARGLVAAMVSLFTAASLHIIAGGNTPTMIAIVSCLIVSTFVCVALSGKKLSLPKLGLAVTLSQFFFHSVFSVWNAVPASGVETGHLHHHLFLLLPNAAPQVSADSGMWLAHAFAAVATIAALRYGELAFWSVLATARLWLGAVFAKLALSLPVRTPRPAAPVQQILPPRELLLLYCLRHLRGPPSANLSMLALA
jgi:hypothetical protein